MTAFELLAIELLAIVPARGGSKGLPRKNVLPLGGIPLLLHSVRAARGSAVVGRCIVSSDDPEILELARDHGAEGQTRSAEASGDDSSSESAVREVLGKLAPYVPDAIVLLQPTSPLRTAQHVDAAVRLLLDGDAEAVISVCKPRHHPLKALVANDEGYLRGLVDARSPFLPRQQLPEALQPNGAIYLVRTAAFLRHGFLPADTLPYLMDERSSLDIDTAEDIRLAEFWLSDEASR